MLALLLAYLRERRRYRHQMRIATLRATAEAEKARAAALREAMVADIKAIGFDFRHLCHSTAEAEAKATKARSLMLAMSEMDP